MNDDDKNAWAAGHRPELPPEQPQAEAPPPRGTAEDLQRSKEDAIIKEAAPRYGYTPEDVADLTDLERTLILNYAKENGITAPEGEPPKAEDPTQPGTEAPPPRGTAEDLQKAKEDAILKTIIPKYGLEESEVADLTS
jgi:hypothetical protein